MFPKPKQEKKSLDSDLSRSYQLLPVFHILRDNIIAKGHTLTQIIMLYCIMGQRVLVSEACPTYAISGKSCLQLLGFLVTLRPYCLWLSFSNHLILV